MAATHAAGYRELGERVRVASVCSLGEERSLSLATSLGARHVDEIGEALSDPTVDIVDVCLPTHLHREAAEKAFAAGYHVLLEKPIALTLADADAIIAAAESSGRLLMVGLVLRFWPEYVALHRLIASQELGPPRSVSTCRLSPPPDWNEWMADMSCSERVMAQSPTPGHVLVIAEYEGGRCGLAEAGMAMPSSYPFSSNVHVLCENGAAQYAFSAAPATDGGNIGGPVSGHGLRVYRANGEADMVSVDIGDPWANEIAHFIDSVERGESPRQGTGEQARAALLVSLAVNRSLESGRIEPV
jgi:predicted dehydrogenase